MKCQLNSKHHRAKCSKNWVPAIGDPAGQIKLKEQKSAEV